MRYSRISCARAQPHKVNLDNPDLAILVEVVKSAACLSVLRDYYTLCKYNIRIIATPPDQRPEAPRCGDRSCAHANPALIC